jgi:16S rRNA (cytidine1402-2'-O)-methyltransferase
MTGTLYIVATPIGNLEDITLRALRILKEAAFVYAEDTRKTSILLSHYEIHRHTLNYHAHSGDHRKEDIVRNLLSGNDIALVTDAGTPGVSDPGNELIGFILANAPDIPVVPIPGASAVTTLLSVAGIDVSTFLFIGFFPKKKRLKLLTWTKEKEVPLMFYESPFRIIKTLETFKTQWGAETQVILGRELTKKFEEIMRGNVDEVLEKLRKEPRVRGEIVGIVY